MTGLETIRTPEVREAIWRAELAAWLHNIGKVTKAFVEYQLQNDKSLTDFRLEYVAGALLAAKVHERFMITKDFSRDILTHSATPSPPNRQTASRRYSLSRFNFPASPPSPSAS